MRELGIRAVIMAIDIARASCLLTGAFCIVMLLAILEQPVTANIVVRPDVGRIVLRSAAPALGIAGISRLLEV